MTAGTTSFAKTIHSPSEMTMRTSSRRITPTVITRFFPWFTGLYARSEQRVEERRHDYALAHEVRTLRNEETTTEQQYQYQRRHHPPLMLPMLATEGQPVP